MAENCKQTVIPEVDNTSEDCGECGFVSTLCITTPKALPYIGVLKDETLLKIIDQIVKDLKKKGQKITILQESAKSAAHIYMTANAVETVITVNGTFYKVTGTTTNGDVIDGFTTAANKLTYDVATPAYFKVTAVLNVTGTATEDVTIRIAKNGVTQAASQSKVVFDAAGFIKNAVVDTLVELTKDDYVEVFITNVDSATPILVTDLSFSAAVIG